MTDILLFKGLNNEIFYRSFPHDTDMLWLLHIFHKKKPCHDASKSSLSFLTVFGSTFYFSLMSSKMFNIFKPSWNFMDFEVVGKYYRFARSEVNPNWHELRKLEKFLSLAFHELRHDNSRFITVICHYVWKNTFVLC